MVERDGIAKTEARPVGAQRYSHSMRSIGQWLGTRTSTASGDRPYACLLVLLWGIVGGGSHILGAIAHNAAGCLKSQSLNQTR